MNGRTLLLAAACAALAASGAAAEELDRAEVMDLFNQGKALFHEGNELVASDPAAAGEMYRESVMRLERIVREGDVENGRLYYNVGNAYFRMKDIGRAILSYRRAEQYIPNDPNLRQNLEYARSRRIDRIETPQKRRILETLLFWHYDVSAGARAVIFAACFTFLWVCVGVALFVRRAFLGRLALAAGVLSAFLFGSLLVETIQHRRIRPGVVVAEEVIARKGDSRTYQPSFRDPLHAGTEFVLCEDRGEWFRVELVDGRTCWVPSGAVGLVR